MDRSSRNRFTTTRLVKRCQLLYRSIVVFLLGWIDLDYLWQTTPQPVENMIIDEELTTPQNTEEWQPEHPEDLNMSLPPGWGSMDFCDEDHGGIEGNNSPGNGDVMEASFHPDVDNENEEEVENENELPTPTDIFRDLPDPYENSPIGKTVNPRPFKTGMTRYYDKYLRRYVIIGERVALSTTYDNEVECVGTGREGPTWKRDGWKTATSIKTHLSLTYVKNRLANDIV